MCVLEDGGKLNGFGALAQLFELTGRPVSGLSPIDRSCRIHFITRRDRSENSAQRSPQTLLMKNPGAADLAMNKSAIRD